MAFTKPHSLSQVERDLRTYAAQKAYALMRDVVQAYQIAGLPKVTAAGCLGALFMRLAAVLAVGACAAPIPKTQWMEHCSELYDSSLEVKEAEDKDETEGV